MLRTFFALCGATLLLTGCGGSEPAPDPGPTAAADAEVSTEQALEHVHGLGIDPADGRLIIATHHGLFAAAEGNGRPERIGTSGQDVMGFSVVGKNRFIGSGHPAPEQGGPPALGLIESGDGGRSWRTVSLDGEADFHVLESSGRSVYGFDGASGKLMVSTDAGRTWTARTPPAGIFGLAIAPGDPQRVVAGTEQGLFLTDDAGRRWRPLSPDRTGLLAWPQRDRLVLLGGDGTVQLSADGGARWQDRGSIGGPPAALLADGADLYAALVDGTVKRSVDDGATWTVRSTP